MSSTIEQRIVELKREWVELNLPHDCSKSPIEELIRWQWAVQIESIPWRYQQCIHEALYRFGMLTKFGNYIGSDTGSECHIHVYQQVVVPCKKHDGKISQYVADFAFFCTQDDLWTGPGTVFLRGVVELDGHDFHEKTKEQASKDKARDRAMQKEGWAVLRFTGSDVFADPERCLAEICQFIDSKTPEYISKQPATVEV